VPIHLLVLSFLPTVQAAGLSATGPGFVSSAVGSQTLDLRQNLTQSSQIALYNERQQVTVAANMICIDHPISSADIGAVFAGSESSSACLYYLPAGTYDSQLLHFDPTGFTSTTSVGGAEFTFDGEIVALMSPRLLQRLGLRRLL
jgi:hypothetical protein